ncbi:hypothetical protein ASC97_14115 [Rhizobium sp. Root1203]|jgi:DNA-binding CsgD family transcriptional regulator|uniref:helix-turn-helix domain-containing protein n=1 Tax=Rhizobium sp. Root1203 TaxID=1736427 RepID=UPI00070B7C8C|nr:helix-turn-helix transcriptional regulator [Rhizobium sp. Root1203]KQV12284.1 hypothetical protein ASC97_14115 [Rhizobium sp. Root1203]
MAIQEDRSSRLGDEMMEICAAENFQYYVALQFPQADKTSFFENMIATNWPDDLIRKYRQSDQFFASSFMDRCRRTTLPVVSPSSALYSGLNRDVDLPQIGTEICGFTLHDPSGSRYLVIFSGASSGEWNIHTAFVRSLAAVNTFFELKASQGRPLSRREVECLRWTAAGKSSEEISMILDLSAATINAYIKSAIRKLDVTNRTQAVALACRLRII